MADDPQELPHWYGDAHRDARAEIGRNLRAYYEPPKDTPSWMLALLTQLNKRQGRE